MTFEEWRKKTLEGGWRFKLRTLDHTIYRREPFIYAENTKGGGQFSVCDIVGNGQGELFGQITNNQIAQGIVDLLNGE